MAAYVLIDLEVTDPEAFKDYGKIAGPALKQYGGKLLAGAGTSQTLDGDWNPRQLSIGEFESVEQALRWYNSPEYAPAKELRLKAAKSRAIVVQGV